MKTVFSLLAIVLCTPILSQAQLIHISGFIKSSASNQAINEVSVFESNSGIGTISNKNGYFKLILKSGKRQISFAEEGFKPVLKQLELKKDTVINIALEPKGDKQKSDNQLQASNVFKRQAKRKMR